MVSGRQLFCSVPMKMLRTLVLGAVFVWPATGALVAQESGAADPRLAQAVEAYEAAYSTQVEAFYERRIGKLNGQLDLALGREEDKAIQDGNLDLVTAIRAERAHLEENLTIPGESAADDAAVPPLIQRFRKAWREQKAAIEEQATAAATTAHQTFSQQLVDLEKALTQENKIEQALAVREYRESAAAALRLPQLAPAGGAEGGSGWVTLLEGSDRSGWTSEDTGAFKAVDGGLEARKTSPQASPAYLYYVGEDDEPDVFEAFEVRMRLHVSDVGQANSGFFYHVALDGLERPLLSGFEINIANSNQLMNQTGSIYGVQAVAKPLLNQKQSYELIIRITRQEIVVTARGKEIMRHTPRVSGEDAA